MLDDLTMNDRFDDIIHDDHGIGLYEHHRIPYCLAIGRINYNFELMIVALSDRYRITNAQCHEFIVNELTT
jgi:hypothetical protein